VIAWLLQVPPPDPDSGSSGHKSTARPAARLTVSPE
jgi:hypothetical protein